MRAEDFEQLDEGWRDRAAAGLMAGGLALGTHLATDQSASTQPSPQTRAVHAPLVQAHTPEERKNLLVKTAQAAGLKGDELAQFVAQCAHETGNFAHFVEQGAGNYFKKKYENPRKAKILGNHYAGDGERYKGRGYMQLTGRDNYKRAGQALGLDLEAHPELVERPDVAAKTALWYWKNRVAPRVQNFSNTHAVTKTINPASKGLKNREKQFRATQVAQIDESTSTDLSEIANIPQGTYGIDTLIPMRMPKNAKPLPGGSGLQYHVGHSRGNIEITLFDSDKLVAELDLSPTDIEDTWRVEAAVVDPEFRGRGAARSLYGIALSILKLKVLAGKTQTPHGRRMWLMLNSIPGVEVKGLTWRNGKYQEFNIRPGKTGMRSSTPGLKMYDYYSPTTMIAQWTGK